MVVIESYKIVVTKGTKEKKYKIADSYKNILKKVNQHYKEGADAVEMEWLGTESKR